MNKSIRPRWYVLLLYMLLPVAVFTFTVVVPVFQAFFYSFFNWSGGPNKTFVGLANYADMINDKVFWESFGHNIFLVVACVVGQIGIAFVLVLMISSKGAKLKNLHRTLAFFPSTISAVAVGLVWTIIFDYKYGLINYLLDAVGWNDAIQVWMNNSSIIMWIVAFPLIWQYIGYYMIILFSAISSIDTEIFEVAELDGANALQRAVYITLPLIKNTIIVCMTLCISGNMKAFDHIYVMTNGGPGTSSMVMALYGYKISFEQGKLGYGSTISVGILILSLVIIAGSQFLLNLFTKDKEA